MYDLENELLPDLSLPPTGLSFGANGWEGEGEAAAIEEVRSGSATVEVATQVDGSSKLEKSPKGWNGYSRESRAKPARALAPKSQLFSRKSAVPFSSLADPLTMHGHRA